ncbi:MAG: sel1 repeat family protein [Bdellovibrionaceae bacterium]|nr:sel1 repeat family protein [Pseudobdellovibrionaceae bacterium]
MLARIIFTVLVFIVSLSCTHSQKSCETPCDKDLSLQVDQIACHDFIYKKALANPNSPHPILKKLCETHKLARACSNMAFFFENPGAEKAPDSLSSFSFYKKGCELGDGVSCNNLANLYMEGRGTTPNEKQGVEYLLMGCELNYSPSCYRVAVITARGILLKYDAEAVVHFMKKGCDLGDAMSCHDLGYLYMEGTGTNRNQSLALNVISSSCDMGLARGCGSLGSFYLLGFGPGGVDYARAYELIQRACSEDDPPSCSNLGYMIETGKGAPADAKRAAQYYSKGCHAGDNLGCGNLGVLLAEGRGVARDDKEALPYLERGCSSKTSEACRFLAIFHEEGRANLPKSKSTGKFYRKIACENGDVPSCYYLSKELQSLCKKGEEPILSCRTGVKRMLSICSQAHKKETSVIYRFGTKNHTELQYDGRIEFRIDAWPTEEKLTLSFSRGPVKYEVLETISKNQDPPLKKVKLEINQSNKQTSIDCKYPAGSLNSDIVKKAYNIKSDKTSTKNL